MAEQYKVIAIPDSTRIIINAGKDDNFHYDEFVKPGKKIEVIIPVLELKDPDTGANIGTYNHIKEKLEITEVYDNFSVARKVKRETGTSFSRAIASPMLKEKEWVEYQSLNVKDEDVLGLELEEKEIKIGDLIQFV